MLIDKENIPLVAMDFMNDVHAEDVDIINELFDLVLEYEKDSTNSNKNLIDSKYQEWYNHTVEHFHGEEVMMQEKNFPPYLFHKGEHDKALEKMNEVFNNWKNINDIMILKCYLIEELPQWLNNHIKTMDTVTAMFLKTGLSPCSMN
jgi:hemerythrin